MEMRLLVAIFAIFLALGALSLSISSVAGSLVYLLVLGATALIVARFAREAESNSEMEMG